MRTLSILAALALLATFTGCRKEFKGDTADTAGFGMVDSAGDTDSDTGVDSGTETDDTDTAIVDSGDTASTDTAVTSPCTYSITDDRGNTYEVCTTIVTSIGDDSPLECVSEGWNEILYIDAVAVGGDAVLKKIVFYMISTDYEGSTWLADAPLAMSGISYQNDETSWFEGYGRDHGRAPAYYDTEGAPRVVWEHEFALPIEIAEGEHFVFSLGTEFGGDYGLVPGEMDWLMPLLSGWTVYYGTEAPEDYPSDYVGLETVPGNQLTFPLECTP